MVYCTSICRGILRINETSTNTYEINNNALTGFSKKRMGVLEGRKKWRLTAVTSLCRCCFERQPLSEQSEGLSVMVCLCNGVVSMKRSVATEKSTD